MPVYNVTVYYINAFASYEVTWKDRIVLKPWEERGVPYHGVWWSLRPQCNKNSSTAHSCLRPLSPQLWAYTVLGISPEITHREMAPCSVLGLLDLPYWSVVSPKAPQSHSIVSQNKMAKVRKSFSATFEVKLESHCGGLNQNGPQRLIRGGGIIGGVALWE